LQTKEDADNDYGSDAMHLLDTGFHTWSLNWQRQAETRARASDGQPENPVGRFDKFHTLLNNQKQTLTLALSRRERGLTGVFGRVTPTWDTELDSSFEKPKNRLPLPRERAGVRGESDEDQKIAAFGSSYKG
jgi:hypothetical protein